MSTTQTTFGQPVDGIRNQLPSVEITPLRPYNQGPDHRAIFHVRIEGVCIQVDAEEFYRHVCAAWQLARPL